MSIRRVRIGFMTLMAALTGGYYALPSKHVVIWTTIGLTSACAILTGAMRHHPRRRPPWLLLAVGIFTFAVGDATNRIVSNVLGHEQSFPSVADGIYLGLFFPLTVFGLAGLSRSQAAAGDRASLLDVLALTVGLGLFAWLFLIDLYMRADSATWVQKTISIAYPLYDVLLLAILARLVIALGWTPAVTLMAVGAFGLLLADVLYGLSRLGLGAAWLVGGPIDLGWIVLYGTWGLAALHPSMVALTDPRVPARSSLTVWRVVLLAFSALVAPAVLIVQAVRGDSRYLAVGAFVAAVMFLLVLARLYGAVSGYRTVVSRERVLREAGAVLVAASEATEVTWAVHAAVARLLPSGSVHRVVLALDQPSVVADDSSRGPTNPPALAVAERPGPGTGFVYTSSLGEDLVRRLGPFEVTAKCPLLVTNRASGPPYIGSLFVAADKAALTALREAMEVLASNAALALDRIALSWEVSQRRSEMYFRTLVQNTSDVILILGDDDRIRYASPSAVAMFGMERLTGVALCDLLDSAYRRPAQQVLNALRTRERAGTVQADWVVVHVNGARAQVEASFRDLRDNPTVASLVLILRDVTERRRLEEKLTHLAFHDSLTGLANRTLFHDRVHQAVARASRSGTIVGVLFIDLDDFKVINDTMGHGVGDEVLVAVSKRLTEALRVGDTAARLGGDEFAAIVEDARDPRDVEDVAQRVVAALTEAYQVGVGPVNGPASIGVATTAEAQDSDELLRQADLALYVAKGAGKGQWRRYQAALHTDVLQRLKLRAELDQAIALKSFVLHYQPIVELSSGAVAGLEALLRWQHPTRAMLAPIEFIDVAEDSGLIVPIGDWVLEQALGDAAAWFRRFSPGGAPYVTVNVSARQFRDESFINRVLDRLAAAALPADRLVLEITETLLLHDDDQVRRDLARLRQIGVRIAIDDFGTGYSSLSYLRKVPADILKIEKSFIETVAVHPQQRALVEGILQLASTLGLSVVAEGIEQERDRAVLAEAGCPYGQGYLFSKPLSYADLLTWLHEVEVAT